MVKATPQPLYPQERPGTHFIGGWVGPRAGLDGCVKSHPQPRFDPRTVQSVVSHYTDRAILAQQGFVYFNFLYAVTLHIFLLSVNVKMCLTPGWGMFPNMLCFENCSFLGCDVCVFEWVILDVPLKYCEPFIKLCSFTNQKTKSSITPLWKIESVIVMAFVHRLNCVNA